MLATGHHSNAFATANNNGFDAAPVRRNSVGDQSTLERECRMYAEV